MVGKSTNGLPLRAPLPEGIENLIAAWGDQAAGSSVGGTSRVINAAGKFGFKNNDLKKRHSQSIRELLQQCAAARLINADTSCFDFASCLMSGSSKLSDTIDKNTTARQVSARRRSMIEIVCLTGA